jgi:predicted DNA-binding WGR domain protein
MTDDQKFDKLVRAIGASHRRRGIFWSQEKEKKLIMALKIKAKKAAESRPESYDDFRERVLSICAREKEDEPVVVSKDLVKRITLYLTNPAKNSDKVYVIEIVKNGTLFDVPFEYGRRGSNLKKGFKKTRVPLNSAQWEFDKVVREKKDEGYTEDIRGGL